MSENQDEKMRKLREEVNALKEQLIRISDELEPKEEPPAEEEPVEIKIEDEPDIEQPEPESEEPEKDYERHYYRGPRPDRFFKPRFMDELGDYIDDFVEDVMEGVSVGLEESLRMHPHGRPHPRPRPRVRPWGKIGEEEAKNTSNVMSALANEHRIKILDELSYGGMYASDFQDKLPEISASTLSSHLDVLEKAGLITQERRRGRYVISLIGRLAVKMAFQINRLAVDARDSSAEGFED